MCSEIEGLYDQPSYTGKNITCLLPLAFLLVLRTRNNTDSNKIMIFSSIALYYGDTFILLHQLGAKDTYLKCEPESFYNISQNF